MNGPNYICKKIKIANQYFDINVIYCKTNYYKIIVSILVFFYNKNRK
jgi:hypothetical protein